MQHVILAHVQKRVLFFVHGCFYNTILTNPNTCVAAASLKVYNNKKATIMDNKGAIVPAAQVPEETSRTFEQVSISKEDGLTCNGSDQTDGECDNYYIGKNELHCSL